MKLFAITPDDLTVERLLKRFRLLKDLGTSHVYLRSPLILSSEDLQFLIEKLLENKFVPLVPFSNFLTLKDKRVICHFRESDRDSIEDSRLDIYKKSASTHSILDADQLLKKGVDFVFLSPIFHPYSKKNYIKTTLDIERVKELVELYGERVVLLGGLDFDRINRLREKFCSDFSVAGITMFF